MKNTLKVAFLALSWMMLFRKAETKFCGMKLRGSGSLTYPAIKMKSVLPNANRKGFNKTENCIIFGKVSWTRDLLLNFSNVKNREKITISASCILQKDNFVRSSVSDTQIIKIAGNISRRFKIEFPKSDAIFTLSYNTVKVRKFLCADWEQQTKNIAVSCSEGQKRQSNCTLQCREGHAFKPQLYDFVNEEPLSQEVHATCRKDTTGAPAWILDAVMYDGVHRRKPAKIADDVVISCEAVECKEFPENINVVSCTSASNLQSNCTLQCKDGFVPAPHLYQTENFSYPMIHENSPTFWATCRQHPKYENYAIWIPPVSTDGLKNFRDPDGLYLDCMDMNIVRELCFRTMEIGNDYASLLDFYTARDFNGCPYSIDQFLIFMNEQSDGPKIVFPTYAPSHLLIEFAALSPEVKPDPRPPPPDVMPIPDNILHVLTDEGWGWVVKRMEKKWSDDCARSLKRGLYERPPEKKKDNSTYDYKDANMAMESLKEMYSEECPVSNTEVQLTSAKTFVTCNAYCIWDNARGDYKPCGDFTGIEHIKNCFRCKYGNNHSCKASGIVT